MSKSIDSSTRPDSPPRDHALDLTRATLTVLVIAHHAVLAYHRYAPPAGNFSRQEMMWGAFPVIDAARAPVVDAFTLWNDTYFMAMMFLLAGLFVAPSLTRKGAAVFMRDRVIRLGIPFVVSAALLAPLAYWPAYLVRAGETDRAGFIDAWLSLGIWPAGPAWFLWVLLAFSALAAALHVVVPRVLVKLSTFGAWCRERPVGTCATLGGMAAVTYLLTTRMVSPFEWDTWGPFTAQTSRLPLYGLYFFFGYALSTGRAQALGDWMSATGPLSRRHLWWQTAAGLVFAGFVAALIIWLTLAGKGTSSALVDTSTNLLFALTGVTTTFALLAVFARWGHRTHPIFTSLSENAFGMYLVHYVIVTWTQYFFLAVLLPGFVKATLVTVFAIGASWGTTFLLRRIPGVRRVI